jgi:prophage regulatory protein
MKTTTTKKPQPRLISKGEILVMIGVSYPTIWQWMRDGKFPRSRELGGKAAWLESEVEEWIRSRPLRRLKGDGDTAAA